MRVFFATLLLVLTLVTMTMFSGHVFAQPGAAWRDLLENPAMQQKFAADLQLTEEQGQQLLRMKDELEVRVREMATKHGPMLMNRDKREAAFSDLQDGVMKISEEANQKLRGILNEKQYGLYNDRAFQMSGGLYGMLVSPSAGQTLNLTPDQVVKIQNIQTKLSREAFALYDKWVSAPPGERGAIMREFQALGEKGTKMIEDILDDTQKGKMQKLNAEMPDYILDAMPNARGGRERAWRPGANSWKPGEGAPQNVDVPREERGREGRKFPGQTKE